MNIVAICNSLLCSNN